MLKLTETFAKKLPDVRTGTDKYCDAEIKGLVLFVGKRSKTWHVQKDVGGQTKRILIGRFPIISAQAARQSVRRWQSLHHWLLPTQGRPPAIVRDAATRSAMPNLRCKCEGTRIDPAASILRVGTSGTSLLPSWYSNARPQSWAENNHRRY